MAEKELQIIIDDGKKRVPIVNKFGEEVGYFYFTPTDINMIKRYEEIADKFDTVLAPLENAGIDANGEGTDDESVLLLNQATERLYELLDYMFNGNMSEAFFGKINPFSPINGNFYCLTAIDTVMKFVAQQLGKESKKVGKTLSKYTERYAA